jgi:hypothetical protein
MNRWRHSCYGRISEAAPPLPQRLAGATFGDGRAQPARYAGRRGDVHCRPGAPAWTAGRRLVKRVIGIQMGEARCSALRGAACSGDTFQDPLQGSWLGPLAAGLRGGRVLGLSIRACVTLSMARGRPSDVLA